MKFILEHSRIILFFAAVFYCAIPCSLILLFTKAKKLNDRTKIIAIVLIIFLTLLASFHLYGFIDNEINSRLMK